MPARHVTLSDGAVVVLRPITPQDRDALHAGFDRLSPESRYRRFFSPMPRLSERDLDYLTQIDHHDHEALLAIDEPSGDVVGVARFVRTGSDEAEPAIVIADDWQGRGLGTQLLDGLAERARDEGLVRFRAPVLAENATAISVLGQLGETQVRRAGREVEVEILLTPEQVARPRLLMLLRGAANGTLAPARTLLAQLAARAPATAPEEIRNTVVVGTDGSETGDLTVRFAGQLASALGASVELVTAGWPLLELREDSDVTLDELARELRARDLEVTVHERRAIAALALIDVAVGQRARLIVVDGSRSAGGARLLPGDMTDTVARQAPCDVLVFRERPPVP